jgi:hypothetical protein
MTEVHLGDLVKFDTDTMIDTMIFLGRGYV